MSKIEFSRQETDALVDKIQTYMNDELDCDVGQFDAEFFLDFLSKELGPFYYNRGLSDAQTVLSERFDTVTDAIYELEKTL